MKEKHRGYTMMRKIRRRNGHIEEEKIFKTLEWRQGKKKKDLERQGNLSENTRQNWALHTK